MKFRNLFVNSVMGSIAGHAVVGAAMMGMVERADPVETSSPPKIDPSIMDTLKANRELSNALTQEFFSRNGMHVDMSSNRFLQMAGDAPPLYGHVELCKRLPDVCFRSNDSYAPLRIDAEFLERLTGENILINGSIEHTKDQELYGTEEYWNFPKDGKGDCDDYVLAKMKRFHEEFGVPLNNMSIVYVEVTPGEKDVGGHVVLALRTSDGDYIFDNRTNDVVFPYATDYRYVSATSFENFTVWKDVGGVKYELILKKGNGLMSAGDTQEHASRILNDPRPLGPPMSFTPSP